MKPEPGKAGGEGRRWIGAGEGGRRARCTCGVKEPLVGGIREAEREIQEERFRERLTSSKVK